MGFRFSAPASDAPVVAPEFAPMTIPAATRFRPTLRMKGVIALSVLIGYVAIIALYVTHERGRLLHIVQQLEQVHERHQLLTKVNTGLTHSIVSLQSMLNSRMVAPPMNDISLDLASFTSSLPLLKTGYPEAEQSVVRLERNIDEMVKGRTRDTLTALRDGEQQLAAQLEYFENEVERNGEQLSGEYRELNQHISAFALITNLLGLPVLLNPV